MNRRGLIRLGKRWRGPSLVMGLLVIAVLATPVVAQRGVQAFSPGEALYEIRLVDGSVFFARVTAVEGETIVLVTLGGTRLEVERSQIREASLAEGKVVQGSIL